MRNKKSPVLIILALCVVMILAVFVILRDQDSSEDSETTAEAGESTEMAETVISLERAEAETSAAAITGAAKESKTTAAAKETTKETQKETTTAAPETTKETAAEEGTSIQDYYAGYEDDVDDYEYEDEDEYDYYDYDNGFYGIWCAGDKSESKVEAKLEEALEDGFWNAEIFLTTDWSNLNTKPYYVLTTDVYMTKEEAQAALAEVQEFFPDAYVKFSGYYQG